MPPDSRPQLDRWFERHFDDQEPTGLGSGWLSGTAAVFLGALSLGGVACLRFPEAIDKNFAVHLPWIDRLFGTHHFPKGQWPSSYGLGHDHVPDSYLTHLLWPFRRR